MAVARADAPAQNPTAAWADAVAAGGWAADTRQPILLTPTDAAHPAVIDRLDGHDGAVVVLGGDRAISTDTAQAVGFTARVDGVNRFATAVAIAERLWTAPSGGFIVSDGGSELGWTTTLAAAGLAADTDRPVLLTELARLPSETEQATCATGERAPVLLTPAANTAADVAASLSAPCG